MASHTSARARKLMARGRSALRDGLPAPADADAWIGVGLILLDELRKRPSGASRAADIALEAAESTLARRERPVAIACKRGCAFCCHGLVSASAPEVLRIARWIALNATAFPRMAPAAVIERGAPRAGHSVEELDRRKLACPLLVDGACGAYSVRPINCRRLLSTSVDACRADFEGRGSGVPYVAETMHKGTFVRTLLLGAIDAAGFPVTRYELSEALGLALTTPDAEQRWLAGEDVFAPLALKQDLGNIAGEVNGWSRRIKAAAA
jgi:hypothetical protein